MSGIRDQVSGIAAYNGSAVGGWRWPIWLTEAGPTGCLDTPFLSRSPTTCARDSLAYANESHLAGHVQGVLTAMNQSSAAAQWAKTFTWHSHNETVFNTAERKYEGDERGLLLGAFSNRVMGRPAFTAYAGVAGPLRLSGADYGYNQQVPVTANPAVPGSYYYVWEYRWCYNGNATGDCDYRWYHYREGQDVSTISPYLNRQDFWEEVRVRQYAWQGGPQLGAAEKTIYGAGECTDPRGCPIRPLGGGGAGADSAAMAAADTVAALRAPAKRPPGVSDVTWERMKGHKGRGNG